MILAGKVTSATDTDGDKANDTFEIDTNGDEPGGVKKVKGEPETKDMKLIEVGDHVEIKVKIVGTDLQIDDVIKIGE